MNFPTAKYENELWKRGVSYVGGIDEVGRGCFAGPIVAACVVFPKDFGFDLGKLIDQDIYINDSKKVTQKRREKSEVWIKSNALSWGIGSASVSYINQNGIVHAANKAFRESIVQTAKESISVEHVLIDAFSIQGYPAQKQTPITKGDSISFTIAAASILAKVYRDKLMEEIAQNKLFAPYKWAKNKGYGTKEHRNAILKHGITKHHRTQYVNTFLSKLK